MNKSMYSLMLMDELVEQIDELAYKNGTNRSNMINQILANYLSYTTPEMRVKEVIDKMYNIINNVNAFQIQPSNTDQALSIKSSLKYKYRPTVKYQVELNKQTGREIGVLKINFRTQSPELLNKLDIFFRLWISIEEFHLGKIFPKHQISYSIGEGRLTRTFVSTSENSLNSDVLSNAITNYIKTFDTALKAYLEGADSKTLEAIYIKNLNPKTNIL